ncbi:thioredoxin family protein [Serpentinicella sp. ANB-PHB4]|uniref:thioredoxin family protein n=1 Tax=Serpentinicella sp. ANB-PHB4 TaxID=3074076 RepID=UPI00285D6EE0|nr:thioredoxin family protein [Serpentinicella sp. ANB-PHB4]MDR5658363.1 thioredoxin family protein [Serpentinicella sp. ANB-PHB4]
MKEIYLKGVQFQTFLEEDLNSNKEKTLGIYNNFTIDQNLKKAISDISKEINVLAFAEIWCPDCRINVPALQILRNTNRNFDFRILPREGYEIHMQKYEYKGKPRIPTFIIMDKDFNELGVFVERPSLVKERLTNGSESDIEITKRKYKNGEYLKNTIEEILSIIL